MDELDRRLLAALRLDGRAPVAALARELGVTRATVNARIDKLVAAGTIVGFSVKVREGADPEAIRSISLIEVEGRTTQAVINELRGIPGIASLHTTNGGWDLIAELQTDSLPELDRLLAQLRSIEGVRNSQTNLLLSSVLD